MCTVTFIPTKTGALITSNRDEHQERSCAFVPEKHIMNGYEIVYPTDPDAGGSWIAVKSNDQCAVLLNGAFTKHIPSPPYSSSRGIVFLDIINASNPLIRFNEIELIGIEPFTVILFEPGNLCECRWDGKQKHQQSLSPATPHIWSSATLYDKTNQQKKEEVFNNWISSSKTMKASAVIKLHRQLLCDNKKDGISTVSITSIAVCPEKSVLTYHDLNANTSTDTQITKRHRHLSSFPARLKMSLRTSWIRITHWEYWPFAVVYAPLLPYWFWLSLKARSFFFFSAANPSIENAGFVLEKKKLIYDLIPERYYPKTIFCTKHNSIEMLSELIVKENISYPLIAKPNIGQKGMAVKLLKRETELVEYLKHTPVDFLVQEYISYEQEVGIFYYRIPGSLSGNISGIVGKEFLSVTGDGISTIKELLIKEDRFLLQLPVLQSAYGKLLDDVLPVGTVQTLVPYGNHSRGAKFIDLSDKINDRLTKTIDGICKAIPGFYYGRLDIKFNNWDELCGGENFSIIELNGAGSEPTHMYDPSHSLFFAWREILRHWNILYTISRKNASEKGIGLMRTTEGLRMLKENTVYLKLIS